MLRSDLIERLKNIQDLLKDLNGEDNELLNTYVKALRNREKLKPELNVRLLRAARIVTRYYNEFGDVERLIFTTTGLDMLLDDDFWVPGQTQVMLVSNIAAVVGAIDSFIDGQIALLDQKHIGYRAFDSDLERVVTFYLFQEDTETLNPDRLVSAIKAVQRLYTIYCEIFDEPNIPLRIWSIDSGSDNSFDFSGFGQALTAVRDTLIGTFEFFNTRKVRAGSAKIKLVQEAVEAETTIARALENGEIDENRAKIYREQLTAAVNDAMDAGVAVEGMEDSLPTIRKLTNPETKQIDGPPQKE